MIYCFIEKRGKGIGRLSVASKLRKPRTKV